MEQKENKYDNFLITESRIGNFKGVKKALEKGADVNAVNYQGNSALITACMFGIDYDYNDDDDADDRNYNYLEVIKLLFLYDIDITKKNKKNYTALTYACMNNNPKMVKLLLDRWDWLSNQNIDNIDNIVCKKNNDIKTGMIFACYYGNLEIMKILFESNIIDINTIIYDVNEKGFPISHDLLYEENYDYDYDDYDDYYDDYYDGFLYQASTTPLLITACLEKHTDIINYLLNLPNIDINVKNTRNETPIMVASEHGFTEVVALLLNHPNIDIFKSNEKECYRIAPSWTFNPSAPTAPTAITYAWDKDHTKIIKLFNDYILNKKMEVMSVIYNGKKKNNEPLLSNSHNNIGKIIISYVI